MIKRIIDKSTAYYGGDFAPTGTEFCRIMQAIAIKSNDKLHNVISETVAPLNTSDNAYRGRVRGYEYDTDDDKYKFIVEEWVKESTGEELYLFIGMRMFMVDSYDEESHLLTIGDDDNSFYYLMKEAEIEGNLSNQNHIFGTLWAESSDELVVEYKAFWDNYEKKEITKDDFNSPGVKNYNGVTVDGWKVLKRTTGLEATARENHYIISPQTGMAMVKGDSKYAPYYVEMDMAGDDVPFTLRIYLGTTEIDLDKLPEFETKESQYWASIEEQSQYSYSAQYSDKFEKNGYYDGEDFAAEGDDAGDYRTPEKIYLFRMCAELKIPLIFKDETSYAITDYGYYDAEGANIKKMGQFAYCTKELSWVQSGIGHFLDKSRSFDGAAYVDIYFGYYGRYMYNSSLDDSKCEDYMGRVYDESLLISDIGTINVPGMLQESVLIEKTDSELLAVDVSESNSKIMFDFKQVNRFDYETPGGLTNNTASPFFLFDNTYKKNKIKSIVIKSVAVENPYIRGEGKAIFVDKDTNDVYYSFDDDSAITLDGAYSPGDESITLSGDIGGWPDEGEIFIDGLRYGYDDKTGVVLTFSSYPDNDRWAASGESVYLVQNLLYSDVDIGELVSIDDSEIEIEVSSNYDEDMVEESAAILINDELIYIDWDESSDSGDNVIFEISQRAARGTLREEHSVGDKVYLFDYMKTGEGVRDRGYNIDYSGKYKAKISLNKYNSMDSDVSNIRMVYVVEVRWQL